ncbi:MAG: hypothetical protein ACOZNI_02745 [Myxococcota bacterium]
MLACGPAPHPFDACDDPTCRVEVVLREWETDPAGTAARVAAVPDDLERTLYVEKLTEAHPNETKALCASLPEGRARKRCETLNARPHLGYEEPAKKGRAPAAPPRTAPGPGETRLPVGALPLAGEGAADVACDGVADRGACVDAAARALAAKGALAAVPVACAAHESPKLRDECVFLAAEGVSRGRGAGAYAKGATLCAAAGEFAFPCHTHLLLYGLDRTPRAEAMTEADVAAARAFVDAIRATWATAAPDVGESHAGWFWARWLFGAWDASETVPGTPIAWLPDEAVPHARAAVTARLQALGRLTGPIDARVATVEAALATRARPEEKAGRFRPTTPKGTPKWTQDRTPEEAATPTIWYLGLSRRPVHPDPKVDLALCVVAAAAHAQPPDTAVLAEAKASGEPLVAAYAGWVTPPR